MDHFSINCADFAKASAFYDEVLGVLGYSRQMDLGVAIGYCRDGHPDFSIADGKDMGPAFVRGAAAGTREGQTPNTFR